MAQFDCLSETQPPQRLLFVGFPCVNPTYEAYSVLLHTAMNCYRFNSCVGNELAINQKLI